VGHITGTSGKLGGSDRVTSSDDSDGTLVLGKVGKDINNIESSLLELIHLEDSHRSVHDDSLAVRKSFLLELGGLRTVIKSHPSFWDGIKSDNLDVGIGREGVSDNNVDRKDEFLSESLGLVHDIACGFKEVVLNKGGSNLEALSLKEGEDHASSDDDLFALVEKGFEDGDLGGNLGSTNDGSHWLLSVRDGTVKVFELLGKEESRDRWAQVLGNTLSGGMGTVGSSESIVDEHVERSGELLDEFSIVLLLFLVEAGVLEHENGTLSGTVDGSLDVSTDAVTEEGDISTEELTHAGSARSKGELVLRTILRAAQVGANGDDGTLRLQVLDGRNGGADTGVIGDGLSVKRNVDITTDEDLLSLEFTVGEVLDGLLDFKLSVESSRGSSHSEGVCKRENITRLENIGTPIKIHPLMATSIDGNNLRAGAKAALELAVTARAKRTALTNFILSISLVF
jgi:hypothetical protein